MPTPVKTWMRFYPQWTTAFRRFEENGISQADLDRIKAGAEVEIYGRLDSALGKAIALGEFNTLSGDPERINSNIRELQALTTGDVVRVYNTYLKDRPYVVTSFVPKGQLGLALEGSVQAEVVEEVVVQGAEQEVEVDHSVRDFERTPSTFDRTVEPPFGSPYELPAPAVWRESLANGIEVYGIESSETTAGLFLPGTGCRPRSRGRRQAGCRQPDGRPAQQGHGRQDDRGTRRRDQVARLDHHGFSRCDQHLGQRQHPVAQLRANDGAGRGNFAGTALGCRVNSSC